MARCHHSQEKQMTRPLFEKIGASDEELAREVAARLGADMPQQAVRGVAANARLLQRHYDVLRGEAS